MKNGNTSIFIIFFVILCFVTMYANSNLLVDTDNAVKDYCFIFFGSAFLLYCVIFFIRLKRLDFNNILVWSVFVIVLFAESQAIYGILQYFNIFPGSSDFIVTGSFDNPAGFVSSLCVSFPFILYYCKEDKIQFLFCVIGCVVICTAIVLSGNRSGIISILILLFLFKQNKIREVRYLFVLIVGGLFILFLVLYIVNVDSANGRLLIWKCSFEMFFDKPYFGFGNNGFEEKYMDYQAAYFVDHINSRYIMIADNVNYPFNEYLCVLIKYGIIGFSLFIIVLYYLIVFYMNNKNKSKILHCSFLSIISFIVISTFSYPLKYSYVILILLFNIFCVFVYLKSRITYNCKLISLIRIIIIMFLIYNLYNKYNYFVAECEWKSIVLDNKFEKNVNILDRYDEIYDKLKNNKAFLYNYAFELNTEKEYYKGLEIALRCEGFLANYDLQLLIGELHMNAGMYGEAKKHYIKASYMCPNRFRPLYKIFEILLLNEQIDEALCLGNYILTKEVKVNSYVVDIIKLRVKHKIDAYAKMTVD